MSLDVLKLGAENADLIQALAALVSIVALLPSAIIFFINQRDQIIERKEAKYLELDSQYRDFLLVSMQHPELNLDLGCGPRPDRALTAADRRRRDIAFDIVTSLFERAFILYHQAGHSFRAEQWAGWKTYITYYCARRDYLDWWTRVCGDGDWEASISPGASQYDRRFEEFLFDCLRKGRQSGIS